jgi:macrolide transport system ATP-binding/permease protein
MKTVDDAVRLVNAGVMTYEVKTGETLISGSPTAYLHRYPAWLAGAFAVFALALAVIGLYGIVAYSVSQRTREIGIRIALGAQPGTVRTMVLRESLRLTGIGLLVGVVGAAASAQMLRTVLFGISAWDPGMLATIATVCGLVAVGAAYLPAYRASTVDPMVALRYE